MCGQGADNIYQPQNGGGGGGGGSMNEGGNSSIFYKQFCVILWIPNR